MGGGQGKREVGDEGREGKVREEGEQEGEGRKIGGGREGKRGKICALKEGRGRQGGKRGI